MSTELARQIVLNAGYCIDSEARIAYGAQVCLASGQVINVYDTGTVVVQGVNPDPVRVLFAGKPKAAFKRNRAKSSSVSSTDLFSIAANSSG